jgi:signal transduction histidine kinase
MPDKNIYRIRPAGRHLLTIGPELIQDPYAAVIELVKNAYDADSPDVKIQFSADSDEKEYEVIILDHGHGMTLESIKNNWLVPSTSDKLERQTSPNGRTMQGSKGIGRYAAAVLGNILTLETIVKSGEKNTISINWDDFSKAEFLDDVPVVVETSLSSAKTGTALKIRGGESYFSFWDKKQFDKLRFELMKLMPPLREKGNPKKKNGTFTISLSKNGFDSYPKIKEKIDPFPLFEYYDYKISGQINAGGKGVLIYSSQKARNIPDETMEIDLGKRSGCGNLVFDIRAYDREKEAIETLIKRGLTKPSGDYMNINEARAILNDYNGIGVYRNGFRIRPLGDPEFDWLTLNKRRVQNPSKFIGSDQIIGFVLIESERKSRLIEKSARDGLKTNTAYDALINITTVVISKLEEKRYKFRRDSGLSRSGRNINNKLDTLYLNEELKQTVITVLKKGKVESNTINRVDEIFSEDAEKKTKIAEDIRNAVGIYQGQATLGKIINVILHEGRRPLHYFKNQIPNLKHWYNSILTSKDPSGYHEFLSIAEGIGLNASVFVTLFNRLDPLAMGKRSRKSSLNLKKMIYDIFSIFEKELKAADISFLIEGPDDMNILAWPQDIYAIFTNLIDNSIYWIVQKKSIVKKILVDIVCNDKTLSYIDYQDSGPGIEPDLIESEVIFEPDFSTKPNGTGLGLAIAGESALRNNMETKINDFLHSDKYSYDDLHETVYIAAEDEPDYSV